TTGPLDGLQAEFARVPLADPTLVKLPDSITDDQAILLSDIFPTGYFGADLAEIKAGDTVAVFGCGPVGLFTALSARLLGAGRGQLVGPALDPRRRALAGAAVGRRVPGQGRHAVHHRRLPRDDDALPDRPGHDEEPDVADGQLPPPQVPAPAHRDGAGRQGGP